MRKLFLSVLLGIVLLNVTACGTDNKQVDPKELASAKKLGTLQFVANGEDFIRQGFTSKDGWALTFEHVYMNITDVTAYQAEPPYDAHNGGDVSYKEKVVLTGVYTVDLAEGDENAPPVLLGEAKASPAGQYNAISWRLTPAAVGPSKGYSLVIMGKAEKDGEIISFTIKDETEYRYTGGEYVGEERKGVLQEGGFAEMEMTFHFDHIFGDIETPQNDSLNTGALGFKPFAQLANDGRVEADMATLKDELEPSLYNSLVDVLQSLGHVGEGHCHVE